MAVKESLKQRFDALDPDKKRKLVMILALGSFVTLISIAVIINESGKAPRVASAEADPDDVRNVLMTTESRELGLQGVANDVDALAARLAALEAENQRLKDEAAQQAAEEERRAGREGGPDAALSELARDVETTRGSLPGPLGTLGNRDRPGVEDPLIDTSEGVVRPTRNDQIRGGVANNGRTEQQPLAAPQIQTFRAAPDPAVTAAAQAAVRPPVPPVYLPTGSIFTGVMMNGLDAPTGRNSSNQPIPVLIRVKHEAILPSRYRSDVREAFVLAAGFGDLSSERAYLRAERLSMILKDGQVIDIPLKAAAVGPDGKTGVRGRVVSKQGAVIGKALLSGMADGISRAFGGTQIGGSSNGEDVDIAGAAFGGGASSGLDRVASYFLAQAEAMYPVVEIDAGREVSFILLEGVDLAARAAAAVEGAVSGGTEQGQGAAAPSPNRS